MDVQINYWAVLLAAASSMVVGSIWYAKPVFGNVWLKLSKIDQKKGKAMMGPVMGLTFVMSLLTAYILAHLTALAHAFFGNSYFYDAVSTAFWVWLGLVVTRIVTHNIFDQRPAKLTVLAVGNELVTIVVMGLVIGLVHP